MSYAMQGHTRWTGHTGEFRLNVIHLEKELASHSSIPAKKTPWTKTTHEKRRLPRKDPDVGKDGGYKEKGTTEDEMVGQCSRSY